MAQDIPDVGDILRETESQFQPEPPKLAPHAEPKRTEVKPAEGPTFVVREFVLDGVTLISIAELQRLLEPWVNREITFADIEQALAAIADFYQQRGWFARAQIPEQDLGPDGVVIINVIEARLGEVLMDEENPLPIPKEDVLGYIHQNQKTGEPLNTVELNRAIKLMNEMPGIQFNAALAASQQPASTDVFLQAAASPIGSLTVSADNTGSRSTGRERFTLRGSLDNPGNVGDQLNANLMASEGLLFGSLAYSRPVGYNGWRLDVNATTLRYRLIGDFALTDGEGGSNSYGASSRYPLLRTNEKNANLSFQFDHKNLHSRALNTTLSDKEITSLTTVIDGDNADGFFGGGISLWRVAATFGRIDLSGNEAEKRADKFSGLDAHGRFAKTNFSLSRLQQVSEKNTLWLNFDAQLSYNNLDSAEKFSLGGSQSIRAYSNSEASGDHGWQVTAEIRHRINAQWQVTGFYDHGWVQQYYDDNFIGAPDDNKDYALRGLGMSLSYNWPGKFSSSLTYARRIGSNPAANAETGEDSDGTKDQHRIWWSLVALF